jgi:hypothetical protein
MGSERHRRPGTSPRQKQRDRAAAIRAEGLSFAEIGRRLGITKQAAWHLLTRGPAAHTEGVCCTACRAVVTERYFQRRPVGVVLCRHCLETSYSQRTNSAC